MFNSLIFLTFLCREQPPPRGCVLKHDTRREALTRLAAAASARLCVETATDRLPVLVATAAASARLCVETLNDTISLSISTCSRLRAAVC